MTMLGGGTIKTRDSAKVIKALADQEKALKQTYDNLLKGKSIEAARKEAEETLETAKEEAKEIRAKARKQAESVKRRELALEEDLKSAKEMHKEAQDKLKEADLIHAEVVKRSEVVEQKIAAFNGSIEEMEVAKASYHAQIEKLKDKLREFLG